MGGPTKYTEELGDKICNAIATSECGIPELCKQNPDFPHHATIRTWVWKIQSFRDKYYTAKAAQADLFAESTMRISQEKHTFTDRDGNEKFDPGAVAWQKLNVNTRHWHASKLLPKIYGDKKEIERLEDDTAQLKAEVKALTSKLDKANESDY